MRSQPAARRASISEDSSPSAPGHPSDPPPLAAGVDATSAARIAPSSRMHRSMRLEDVGLEHGRSLRVERHLALDTAVL
jgi:hypothetical protein